MHQHYLTILAHSQSQNLYHREHEIYSFGKWASWSAYLQIQLYLSRKEDFSTLFALTLYIYFCLASESKPIPQDIQLTILVEGFLVYIIMNLVLLTNVYEWRGRFLKNGQIWNIFALPLVSQSGKFHRMFVPLTSKIRHTTTNYTRICDSFIFYPN